MHSNSRRIAFEQFIERRKRLPPDDLIMEETCELPPTFWSRLLLLDKEQVYSYSYICLNRTELQKNLIVFPQISQLSQEKLEAGFFQISLTKVFFSFSSFTLVDMARLHI